jgi:integrase
MTSAQNSERSVISGSVRDVSSLYLRGEIWWCRLKESGEWLSKSTGCRRDDRRGALRYARVAQERLDKREGASGPLTLRRYIEKWLERRRVEGHDWTADRGRLHNHVLPVLGDRLLAEIRTGDIVRLVQRLRFETDPPLAQRTVHNVYSVLKAAMRDAAEDEIIEATPCILTQQRLGPIRDKDPEWREGAVFTREEAETLISDPRIPADRQLVYGFGLLAGMRPGEVAALRWRHYNPNAEPLGSMLVALSYNTKRSVTKPTKTETTKTIPVHATLAAMLAEWKLGGWAAMVGHKPTRI